MIRLFFFLFRSEQELNDCSPPVIDLTESDLPCDGPRVPPVASMDNLGELLSLSSGIVFMVGHYVNKSSLLNERTLFP